MSENDNDPGRGPEDIFASLRERPTPELDVQHLWRRIETRLAPPRRSLWARLRTGGAGQGAQLRLVYGLAAVAALAIVAAALFTLWSPDGTGGQLVLLTPDEPGAAPQTAARTIPGESVQLDIRLVRGFDGAPPADVSSARNLGVGGADALRDVRGRIEALLPFDDFGVVGAWQGTLQDGEGLDVTLSSDYRLRARSSDASAGSAVRLTGVALAGAGGERVSGDLTLEPGRLYVLGVLAPGEETPELVLLVRAGTPDAERR